ncbi:hypothetical protein HMPREF9123_1894 [Neisseria bacilliformis ATCC BAA-1200]|uniref:Uncharacterized protein n=1 Tax=Neisseria bacilliformis ATCC BAA-1200 TaxID=888742 RepID=F2BDU0_9NEIS|nr:hypothetical protein HMPREF9123_1894 [Neisseria bacilliformis ATCC BAA-1200]
MVVSFGWVEKGDYSDFFRSDLPSIARERLGSARVLRRCAGRLKTQLPAFQTAFSRRTCQRGAKPA